MYKIAVLLLVLLPLSLISQVTGQFVEEHAIEIVNRAEQNDRIYSAVKDYNAILIGEVHGIQEGPEFLLGLVKSLAGNGKKILVGLEIPSDGVPNFDERVNIDSLKKAPFFTTATLDGRQCIAWAQMLMALKTFKDQIVFIGLSAQSRMDKNINRDSLMYEKLREAYCTDTSRILITLTGNISNLSVPYKGITPMAYYMRTKDYGCFRNKKILSLNHVYGRGTTMNWLNDGFRLREVEGTAGFYEYATSYDNYLFISPVDGYDGIFFSKTVTASEPLIKK
jgi:hypothetical protein